MRKLLPLSAADSAALEAARAKFVSESNKAFDLKPRTGWANMDQFRAAHAGAFQAEEELAALNRALYLKQRASAVRV